LFFFLFQSLNFSFQLDHFVLRRYETGLDDMFQLTIGIMRLFFNEILLI